MPLLFVIAVAIVVEPNFAPGLLAGAVKVTVAPFIGFPLASRTMACNATPNIVFVAALCGVPKLALIVAGTVGVIVIVALPDRVASAALMAATVTVWVEDMLVGAEYIPDCEMLPKGGVMLQLTCWLVVPVTLAAN